MISMTSVLFMPIQIVWLWSNNDTIQHFEGYAAQDEDLNLKAKNKNILVQNSQAMLDNISKTLNKNEAGAKNVLDKLDDIENKIKQHLKGDLTPDEVSSVE